MTCIRPFAPTLLMAYWRNALSTSIRPSISWVSRPARVVSYWILMSRRRRDGSSGTKRVSRADMSRSQRSPSRGLVKTKRAGLTLFTDVRMTEATSSDRVSSRCAPAKIGREDKSSAPPASIRRRRMGLCTVFSIVSAECFEWADYMPSGSQKTGKGRLKACFQTACAAFSILCGGFSLFCRRSGNAGFWCRVLKPAPVCRWAV